MVGAENEVSLNENVKAQVESKNIMTFFSDALLEYFSRKKRKEFV